MKISTQTLSLRKHFSDTQTVDILAEAGFDAIDFSFFDAARDSNPQKSDAEYKSVFTELKKYAESKGLYFNQAHAPFPSSQANEEFTNNRYNELIVSIKNASYLGVRNIIVHPCHHIPYYVFGNAEKLFEMNMKFYTSLIPVCEEYGITVCIENMWQRYNGSGRIWDSACSRADEFCAYIDEISHPLIKGCLDIGHTVLSGSNPYDFIKRLGKDRLAALHIHDNDGLGDNHTFPFHGIIDWKAVAKALKEIGYNGELTLECDGGWQNIPPSLYPEACKYAAKLTRELSSMIENA